MQKLTIENPEVIKAQIRKHLKCSEGRYVHRLHGILLLLENPDRYNCDHVATLFNNSPRSISNWVHKINSTGSIVALIDKPKTGRNPTLTHEEEIQLKEAICVHPSESGIEANLWDGKTVSLFIVNTFNKELKVRQCQRIIKKLGFTLQKPRTVPAAGDPEAKEAFKKTAETSK